MNEREAYLLFAVLLALAGAALLGVAFSRSRWIARTEGTAFERVQMKVTDVNLIPNNLVEVGPGPLTDRTAMVLVNYTYNYGEHAFRSRRVFPIDVEWMRPRIAAFDLFEDLKAGRLAHCYVDSSDPGSALLFAGWSPYLRSHVIGVTAAGVVVFILGLLFIAITV